MTRTDLRPLLNAGGDLPRTTPLVRETGLRAMLLHLREGEEIPEHQNRGAITVQCMQGHVIFFAAGERIELTPGLLISLPLAVAASRSAIAFPIPRDAPVITATARAVIATPPPADETGKCTDDSEPPQPSATELANTSTSVRAQPPCAELP